MTPYLRMVGDGLAWLWAAEVAFVAVAVLCHAAERWMEKRTSRVNGLPAPIPAEAFGDATATGKVIPIGIRLQCARMETPRVRTRATRRTSAVRVLALRNTSGLRG